MAAFCAAAAAGYGVELDVRLSADGEAVVFHDDALSRMTGRTGRIEDLDMASIRKLRLLESSEAPPALGEVLEALGERVLIFVELKTAPGAEGPLEAAVADRLRGAHGPAAVIGFNPMSHAWFKHHEPQLVRGLNLAAAADLMAAFPEGSAVETADPHFLLPSLKALPAPHVQALRAAGRPLAAWTVRSQRDDIRVRSLCDTVIFEGYRP
jgi:glycerophosphoryl diester phosphodiesterase